MGITSGRPCQSEGWGPVLYQKLGYTYATRQTTHIIAHFECHSNIYGVHKKFQKHRKHQQDTFLNTNADSTPIFNICTVPCYKCKDPHVIIQCSESRASQVRIWRDSRENSGRSHVFKLGQNTQRFLFYLWVHRWHDPDPHKHGKIPHPTPWYDLVNVTQQHGGFILRLFKATLPEVTHNCLKAHRDGYYQHKNPIINFAEAVPVIHIIYFYRNLKVVGFFQSFQGLTSITIISKRSDFITT